MSRDSDTESFESFTTPVATQTLISKSIGGPRADPTSAETELGLDSMSIKNDNTIRENERKRVKLNDKSWLSSIFDRVFTLFTKEEKLIYYQLIEQNGTIIGDVDAFALRNLPDVLHLRNEIYNENVNSLSGVDITCLIALKSGLGSDKFNLSDTMKVVLGHCGESENNPVMVLIESERAIRRMQLEPQALFATSSNADAMHPVASYDALLVSLENGKQKPYNDVKVVRGKSIYEEKLVTMSNGPPVTVLVRPVLPPRQSTVLHLLKNRPPSISRRADTTTSIFSKEFRELDSIVKTAIASDPNWLKSLGRICFVEANKVIKSNLVHPNAPFVPVFVQGDKAVFDFTFAKTEPVEYQNLEQFIKTDNYLVVLRAVSGAGKTTLLMAYGMRQRCIYWEVSLGDMNFLANRVNHSSKHYSIIMNIQAWMLARLSVLLYLEEHFNFEPVDLLAAQRSDRFSDVVEKLCLRLLKNDELFLDTLNRLPKSFPTPILVDECHLFNLQGDMTYRQLQLPILDSELDKIPSPLTLLWLALAEKFGKLMLATTQLKTNVDLSIKSAVGKAGSVGYEFRHFTFHKQPTYLSTYIRDFPDELACKFAGRARLGTNVLQWIMIQQWNWNWEQNPEVENSNLQQFYDDCAEAVAAFHGSGVAVDSCDFMRSVKDQSIYCKLENYIRSSQHRTDRPFSGTLFEELVNLTINSVLESDEYETGVFQCSHIFREEAVTDDQLDYISGGIGFLEPSNLYPDKMKLTLREPLLVEAVSNLVPREAILDVLNNLLPKIKTFGGKSEASKGIVFQWIIQWTFFAFKNITIGQLLERWTGATKKTLQKLAPWLSDEVWSTQWQCDKMQLKRSIQENIFSKPALFERSLIVLPNNARNEAIFLLNRLAFTMGIKMHRRIDSTNFSKNVSAAKFAHIYRCHDGRVLDTCQSVRSAACNFIRTQVSGNIALVVSLPNTLSKERFVVEDISYDGKETLPTLLIHFDLNTLRFLLPDVTESFINAIASYYDKQLT